MTKIIRDAALATIQWSALLGVAFIAAHWLSAGSSVIVNEREGATQSFASRLIERHDCWTGEAPADVEIPGSAIVDTGNGARLAPSAVGFAIWEGERPGHLYAFCR